MPNQNVRFIDQYPDSDEMLLGIACQCFALWCNGIVSDLGRALHLLRRREINKAATAIRRLVFILERLQVQPAMLGAAVAPACFQPHRDWIHRMSQDSEQVSKIENLSKTIRREFMSILDSRGIQLMVLYSNWGKREAVIDLLSLAEALRTYGDALECWHSSLERFASLSFFKEGAERNQVVSVRPQPFFPELKYARQALDRQMQEDRPGSTGQHHEVVSPDTAMV